MVEGVMKAARHRFGQLVAWEEEPGETAARRKGLWMTSEEAEGKAVVLTVRGCSAGAAGSGSYRAATEQLLGSAGSYRDMLAASGRLGPE